MLPIFSCVVYLTTFWNYVLKVVFSQESRYFKPLYSQNGLHLISLQPLRYLVHPGWSAPATSSLLLFPQYLTNTVLSFSMCVITLKSMKSTSLNGQWDKALFLFACGFQEVLCSLLCPGYKVCLQHETKLALDQ